MLFTLQDACTVVKKFMERDPENLNFNMIALSKMWEPPGGSAGHLWEGCDLGRGHYLWQLAVCCDADNVLCKNCFVPSASQIVNNNNNNNNNNNDNDLRRRWRKWLSVVLVTMTMVWCRWAGFRTDPCLLVVHFTVMIIVKHCVWEDTASPSFWVLVLLTFHLISHSRTRRLCLVAGHLFT